MVKLGTLTKITDLREVWPNEARDFTPWLAEEDNLAILSNEIGLDIELIETEAKTGSLSTDILAKDAYTDNFIIIENQLEQTDHDHLGKIITYASGHDANTIVWIVKKVKEEHRQAIDWLNEHTNQDINIFLVKIELWKIGDSDIAPKFNIISSPNNWTKTVKNSPSTEISNLELKQLEFWNKFSDYVEKNSNIFKPKNYQKPQPWYELSLNAKYAFVFLTINSKKKTASSQLYIPQKKHLFNNLFKQKEEIEEEMGQPLEWDKKDNRKACKIMLSHDIDPMDENNWDKLIKILLDDSEKLYAVFKHRIDEFNMK